MHLLSALRLLLVSVQKQCPIQGRSKSQQNSGMVGRGEGREGWGEGGGKRRLGGGGVMGVSACEETKN